MNSASLCSLAGRYDNPIPTQCLAPIDCLKIPAQATQLGGSGSLESIPGFFKSLEIRLSGHRCFFEIDVIWRVATGGFLHFFQKGFDSVHFT
jgi:hypothetical protein